MTLLKRNLFLIFFCFWLFFILIMSLEKPISTILCSDKLSTWSLTFTPRYTIPPLNMRCSSYGASKEAIKADLYRMLNEEFTPQEQLSKFYLFLIILISGYAYQVFKKPSEINVSICFVILGLMMYLSESNMISNNPQLLGASFVLPVTFYMLLKNRSWITIILLLLGFCIIPGGILLDYTHAHPLIKSHIPVHFLSLLESVGEENFDVLGEAVICLSVIFCFLDPIKRFMRNNIKGTLSTLISCGFIASGNGLLHFEYHPGRKLQLFAFVLSVCGWIGMILTNKFISKNDSRLYVLNKDLYYTFLFIFFVMLPTVYGTENDELVSIILWFPVLIFIATYLYRKHPTRCKIPI